MRNRTTSVDWRSPDDLAGASARGGLLTAGGTWVRFLIQMVAVVIVARILGPAEYGQAALILIFGAAAELIRSSGFAAAVLQRRDLTSRAASVLHYLSISVGLCAGALLVAIGPVIAQAVNEPRLGAYSLLLAPVLIAAGLSAIPAAILARNLEFRSLALAEVLAVAISSLTGIAASMLGFGALALVVQALVFAALICVGILIASPWRPGRPARWAEVRPYIVFGGNISAVQLLNYLTRNVDKFVISWQFGPAATGLYAQANQLIALPLDQVSGPLQRVAVPVLARITHERERFARYYRMIVAVVGYILWPVFAALVLVADPVILTLFGPEWAASADLFRILVIAGIAQTLGYVNVWLFVATGQAKRQTLWALITRPIVFGSFFLGIPWGMHGVALTFAITSLVMVVPGFVVARKGTPLTFSDLLSPLRWPALAAAFVAATVFATTLLPLHGWVALGAAAIAFIAGYILFLLAVPPARRDFQLVITRVRSRNAPSSPNAPFTPDSIEPGART